MKKLLIEIYDKINTRNNIMTLINDASYDKVVYFSVDEIEAEDKINLKNYIYAYISKNIEIEFYETVDITSIDMTLDNICIGFDDIRAELWGGIAILGVSIARYCLNHDINIISLDEKYNKLYKIRKDGIEVERKNLPSLSMSQVVELNGGEIIEFRDFFIQNKYFDAFEKFALFCIKHADIWDRFTKELASLGEFGSLYVDFDKFIRRTGAKVYRNKVLSLLLECNFLNYREHGNRIEYSYINDDARLICTQKGFVLETYMYLLALKSKIFDEQFLGVKIAWGSYNFGLDDVYNEIDVALRKNNINIFISCKMTKNIQTSAINELELYANRFIGDDNIKIISTTADVGISVANRCRECNIIVLNINRIKDNFIDILCDELRKRGISVNNERERQK